MNADLFARLYEEGFQRTVRFLLSLGFPRDAGIEIAQAAWSRAWERQDQLRDESKIFSWVNTIALNDARKTVRKDRQHVILGTAHERTTTLNLAAIDVARLLERCAPRDREILEAQLEGASNEELAGEHGVSPTAMRLRTFRARRAARRLCKTTRTEEECIDARVEKLAQAFQDQCIAVAQQSLETAETFLRLLEFTSDKAKQDKLHRLVEKGIHNARRSLSRVPSSRSEVALGHRAAMDLRNRLHRRNAEPGLRESVA